MTTEYEKLLDKPAGYYAHLDAMRDYRRNAILLIANALARRLFDVRENGELTKHEKQVLRRMAEHCVIQLDQAGWQLMFSEENEYEGMIQ